MSFRVLDGGLLTTVQDQGRRGLRRYGVPRSGAADTLSLLRANLMVGNEPDQAALECTALGPTLLALADQLVAVTGARCALSLDGEDMTGADSFFVSTGQVLRLGIITEGFRSYLAVSGGFDVPLVLGSRSTYLGASLGGYQGRRLQTGDELAVCPHEQRRPRVVPPPPLLDDEALRVIRGPQASGLTASGFSSLFEQDFKVTNDSDRMGCRLEGEPLQHARGADIISDGVPEGSLQVPGDGQPIIMLADGQPTGGYVKPVVIVTADLPRAAQLAPGTTVRLREVTLDQAHEALHRLQEYRARCHEGPQRPGRYFSVRSAGRTYQVHVQEIPNPSEGGRHSPDNGE